MLYERIGHQGLDTQGSGMVRIGAIASAQATFLADAITWAKSGFPPTSCNTLGCFDLSRVPLPAAMIAMAVLREVSGLLMCVQYNCSQVQL